MKGSLFGWGRVDPERIRVFSRRADGRPLVLGHRGARARAPENTIEAFDLAMDEGADGIELDVRMTSDGELVIAHDDELHLRSGRTATISRLSYPQLRTIRETEHAPVPTLREALEWKRSRGALMNVELKGDVLQPAWMTERAMRLVEELGQDGILVSSFDPRQVFLAARLLDVPVGLLVHTGQRVTGRLLRETPLVYRALGAVAVHPERTLLDASLGKSLDRDGVLVNTWTVNEPEEALRLSALGVDAIITDRPREILAALEPT